MKKIYLSKQLLAKLFTLIISACMPFLSYAQYATATQYPFIANEEPFTYVTGGTTVPNIYADDAQTNSVPIGFTFRFMNVDYTNVSVSSNGWMSFTSTTANGSGICNDNRVLAQMVTYNAMPVLFPFWDDLGFFVGGTATYVNEGTAIPGSKVFIFEWRGWTWDFAATPGTMSYQVKLYETGSIKYSYKREGGPISSDYGGTSGQAGWFGASIGLAGSTSDYQFLDGSTPDASPTYSPGTYKTNIDSRPFTNQSYMWLAPCNNMTSLNIVAPKEVCAGKSFRLGAVAEPLAVATNCSWFYSDDNMTWKPITGTSGIITDVISADRWYKVSGTCGGGMTSQPILVKLAQPYNCYCKTGATTLTNGNSSAEDIGNLVLETYPKKDTLLKTSEPLLVGTNNQYAVKGYTDYRRDFDPIVVFRDSLYRASILAINWRNYTTANTAVYIDYNINGIFDPWEEVISGATSVIPPTPPGSFRDTFRIPDTAHIGITGMRVVLRTTGTADACNPYADGETEDYLINISFPPCDGAPDAGTAYISDSNMCVGYDYIITDTAYEKFKTNITRMWQASADDVTWKNVLNGDNKDAMVRTFAGQPTYYRLRAICEKTHDTSYTNKVFINSKPTYKCYCHSQAEGGATDTSDIGGFTISTFSVNDGGSHLENPRAVNRRQDRTDLPEISMDVDSSYQFSVMQTQPNRKHSDAKVTIFIDFNNNKLYDIPAERIYTGFTTVGSFVRTGSVIIPSTVITGVPTGLRIIVNNDISPNTASDDACGEYKSGETEDYIVTFVRQFPVNVNDVKGLDNISVYPNPTTGRFTLGFNTTTPQQVNVLVKNVTGQQVYSKAYNHNGGSFSEQIDLSNYAKGIYMVELTANGVKTIQKLVLQ
jgi:hypothetical protein